MTNTINQITKQEEVQSEKIARAVAKLSEEEQAKVYYVIKGIEIAGANGGRESVSAR